MMLKIWVFEIPSFLKKAMTESGLSGVLKRIRLEANEADASEAYSGENPQVLMRYEATKGFCFEEVEKNLRDNMNGSL